MSEPTRRPGRSRPPEAAKKGRKDKAGRPYEEVVALVAKTFDTEATVTRGAWERGPDGHRELDVRIVGVAAGRPYKVMIECKDYNPKSTGPVGIEAVDSIESKRRDLALDSAIICSNAGFTADAIHKAGRTGIGLVSVFRKGDPRVRFSVIDTVYTRTIRIVRKDLGVMTGATVFPSQAKNLSEISGKEVLFSGLPIERWISRKIAMFLVTNPIVNGTFRMTWSFISAQTVQLRDRTITASGFYLDLRIVGCWYEHVLEIESAAGFYDWIRRRIRPAPGPGSAGIVGWVPSGGTPVAEPPRAVDDLNPDDRRHGEVGLAHIVIQNITIEDPFPQLDELIQPADLDMMLPRPIPPEFTTSTPGFFPHFEQIK